jgi:hypothetical protein
MVGAAFAPVGPPLFPEVIAAADNVTGGWRGQTRRA